MSAPEYMPPPWHGYDQPDPRALPLPAQLQTHPQLAALSLATVRVIGSHAYGTSRPDSDIDYRAVYLTPTRQLFGLYPQQGSVDLDDPDLTAFELGPFAQMAAKSNPNVLEILWAPSLLDTEDGLLLSEHRQLFLSQAVRRSYGGYALGQLRQAQKGTGGSRGVAHFRRQKFILHIFRLGEQGLQLLETGDMSLRLSDPDRLWQLSQLPLDQVEAEFALIDARMEQALAQTDLPPQPDVAAINELLADIRLRHLRG